MPPEYDLEQNRHARLVELPLQRTADAPRTGPTVATLPRGPRWQTRYGVAVVVSDLASIVASAALYNVWGSAPALGNLLPGAVVVAFTAVALMLARAWDPTVLGTGSVEFSRLLRGILGSAVAIGLLSLALQLPSGRPWVFGVLPVAGVLAVAGRLVLRRRLFRLRQDGRAMAYVLAVGSEESVASLLRRTRRAPQHGWHIVGACTTTGVGPNGSDTIDGVPVLGDLDSVGTLARTSHFDTVSVAQAPGWTSMRLQQLAWDLEGKGTELVVDPGLMEIAGPRLHMATVDGLPLLRLTHPKFTGASKFMKGALDRLVALLILVLVSPLLLVLAAVVASDGGPVFFRQKRVGLDGREFRMVKFRSMVVDAEARLVALQADNEGAGLLFKIRNDPRVTPIGRVLRKYSLDELPQLFNVVAGSMSLVGPRPPLPVEVAGYARDARRRLLVKPGMTGLWQVSGRSDLSWEQTVRLDLRYVENWTLALDAQILVRTVRAIAKSSGAY
jgi:exopolysaccharide biosynthesis polyprenyl glycosylphosphotransferase